MLTITTLPLAGGGERGDQARRQKDNKDIPYFTGPSSEDEGLTTDHEDPFDDNLKFRLVTISNLYHKVFLFYFVFKLIYRGFPH